MVARGSNENAKEEADWGFPKNWVLGLELEPEPELGGVIKEVSCAPHIEPADRAFASFSSWSAANLPRGDEFNNDDWSPEVLFGMRLAFLDVRNGDGV